MLLRSKFGPLEVAEVAKVQARKKCFTFSSIFELQRTIVIDIRNKITDFCFEKKSSEIKLDEKERKGLSEVIVH